MKELTIEEKAKAYDEAFNVALETYQTQPMYKNWLEKMFPELKESEDEKIRKHLIKHFGNKSKEDWNGVPVKSILAWLEKQCEHANFINKIQIGDKVTRNEDGVLVNLSQLNRVAKKDEKQGETFTKKDVDDAYLKGICDAKHELEKQGEQKPADEVGNYDHKEVLQTIINEQKPAWSEEDEAIYYGVIETEQYMLDVVNGIKKFAVGNISIKEECTRELNWLKSLKDRYTWKPSDEQMEALLYEVNAWDEDSINGQNLKSLYQDLKNLREE